MSKTVEVYKCLGNETRLSIVQELIRRDEEVAGSDVLGSCSLALGLAQPTLSQHFSRLVAAGVITEAKRGVEKYYRINMQTLTDAGIDAQQLTAGEEE